LVNVAQYGIQQTGISFLAGVHYGACIADCSLDDTSFGFYRFRWYETNLIPDALTTPVCKVNES
jgi:hypothetical protein